MQSGPSPVVLTTEEQDMLDGHDGEAAALAMRILVRLAETMDARQLIEISSAHIDSCLYHGQVSLDFAERLAELGARVRVPTTLNVGSVDLIHPGVVRTATATERDVATSGRRLMEVYASLGCSTTFTCAPYQMTSAPSYGDRIAWAESNAIVFANSVLGARTDRYGDFVDICAAICGRVPLCGLQTDSGRRATMAFDCSLLPWEQHHSDLIFPLLGYHIGLLCATEIPVLYGVPQSVTHDDLKAFGAAAASSGGVAMFHMVGITPEASTLSEALQGEPPQATHIVTAADLNRARLELSGLTSGHLDAVSVGTPHASYEECETLARMLGSNGGDPVIIPFYLSTRRDVWFRAQETGLAARLTDAGITVIVDTCTYVTRILEPTHRRVMTNSGKWAHYAPGNIDVTVALGSLKECVGSARVGQIQMHLPLFKRDQA